MCIGLDTTPWRRDGQTAQNGKSNRAVRTMHADTHNKKPLNIGPVLAKLVDYTATEWFGSSNVNLFHQLSNSMNIAKRAFRHSATTTWYIFLLTFALLCRFYRASAWTACSHGQHTERDIVLLYLSVCLSVRLWWCIYKNVYPRIIPTLP